MFEKKLWNVNMWRKMRMFWKPDQKQKHDYFGIEKFLLGCNIVVLNISICISN